jgi:hypothetical protein
VVSCTLLTVVQASGWYTSRGSVASVATGYKTGQFGFRSPAGGGIKGIFLFFKTVQNGCGVHTVNHLMGIEVISRG